MLVVVRWWCRQGINRTDKEGAWRHSAGAPCTTGTLNLCSTNTSQHFDAVCWEQWFGSDICFLWSEFKHSLKIILITQNFGNTVKHAYSQHAYNELMPLLKWFLFRMGFKHIEKLTHLWWCKIALPWHFIVSLFYCNWLENLKQIFLGFFLRT